ncbi:MAG TPA: hypothetical protein PLV25_07720, partial [Opitutales bacterium]|nr:hypothetical protein [Opitutales bacterium]
MTRIIAFTALFLLSIVANANYSTSSISPYYSQATASYITSGDFHGAGGSARIGIIYSGPHCFEAELSFFHMSADTTQQRVKVTPHGRLFNQTQTIAYRFHADINEFPIFLNYKFQHSFGDTGIGMYAGAGIGLSIMNINYTDTVVQNVTNICGPKR